MKMTKKQIKNQIRSAIESFIAGFIIAMIPLISTLDVTTFSLSSVTWGAITGVLVVGVRGGIKALKAMFMFWANNRK